MEIFDKERLNDYISEAILHQLNNLDYYKIDTVLKSVDVQLKDANGQFRSLNNIFLELSEKWEKVNNEQN